MPYKPTILTAVGAMRAGFPRQGKVLDFGPCAHGEIPSPGDQTILLWPAWTYAIGRPIPNQLPLNLLQRAVLGLCHAGRSASNQIADRLRLKQDLVVRIMDELMATGAVGQDGLPTLAGVKVLLPQQTRLGSVLQDPWSGRLWPYLVAPMNHEPGAEGALRPMASSVSPDCYRVLPNTASAPARPRLSEVKDALEQYWNFVNEDAMARRAVPGPFTLLEAAPIPVFLKTLLYVHKGEWHMSDPFGRGSNALLKQQVEQLLPELEELHCIVSDLLGHHGTLPDKGRESRKKATPPTLAWPQSTSEKSAHRIDRTQEPAVSSPDADMVMLERQTAQALALIENYRQRVQKADRVLAGMGQEQERLRVEKTALEEKSRLLDKREEFLLQKEADVEAKLAAGGRQLEEEVDAVVTLFNKIINDIQGEADRRTEQMNQYHEILMARVEEAKVQSMELSEKEEIDLARKRQIIGDQEHILEQKMASHTAASQRLEERRTAVEARAKQMEASQEQIFDELKILRNECDTLREKLMRAPSSDTAERLQVLQTEWWAWGDERLKLKRENGELRELLARYADVRAELYHVLGDLS